MAPLRTSTRDERRTVRCDFATSPHCRQEWIVSERAEKKNRGRNDGRMICLACSRLLKSGGRKNPNTRYHDLDDRFFEHIGSDEKAYLLGWIASDGSIGKGGTIAVGIHHRDRQILEQLRDVICEFLPVKHRKPSLVDLEIHSKQMAADVCRWLKIKPGKKSHRVEFPDLATDSLKWAFLRGYFDGDGWVVGPGGRRRQPRCSIASSSPPMLEAIQGFCGVPCCRLSSALEWNGCNALDFMGRLYDGQTLCLRRKREAYEDWCGWQPGRAKHKRSDRSSPFEWTRTLPEAVAPMKRRASDSGYDLTLIRKVGGTGRTSVYETGIRLRPPYGLYFDLVARSSLAERGYMLVNGFGVIDRAFRGNIRAALLKFDADAPDLVLPARCIQIIPRPIIHAEFVLVDSLDETDRGEGGFGSTGR